MDVLLLHYYRYQATVILVRACACVRQPLHLVCINLCVYVCANLSACLRSPLRLHVYMCTATSGVVRLRRTLLRWQPLRKGEAGSGVI